MRKRLGEGLSSEGKVKRGVLLSFIEVSLLGSCEKAEEMQSMGTLELEIFEHGKVEKSPLGEDLSCWNDNYEEAGQCYRPRGV
ncbi:hypothetical protein V1478_004367 [Vespula squamosa]|uniref:Uncharacterized protein n=1 Tax=Vespula squamosa TaxID=30214 RepID=A0ABD2BI61_VESSQ